MAKKRKGDSSADNVFQVEEDAPKEEPINLWDSASLKRALDEAVIEALHEEGCQVDNTYTDLKIVIGLLACGVACLAQFYPKKYPENFWVLLCCVASYMVLSTVMTVVATVYEKDYIALTKASPGGMPALAVSTGLPRFEDLFTIRIILREAAAAGSSSSDAASLTKSVGDYFHSNGFLAADVVKRDVQELLKQCTEAKTK